MPTTTANVIQKNVTLVALATGGSCVITINFFPQKDWEERTNHRRLPPQGNLELDLCHLNLLSVVE